MTDLAKAGVTFEYCKVTFYTFVAILVDRIKSFVFSLDRVAARARSEVA